MFFYLVLMVMSADVMGISVTNDPRRILSGNYNPPLPDHPDSIVAAMNARDKGYHVPMNGDALTVALDVVQAWAVILTLGFTLIIFFFLAFCVCSRKENSYDEFETTPGITTVKIYTETESNRINMSPNSPRSDQHSDVSGSRYALKRELPAIPTNASSQPASQSRPTSHVSDGGTQVTDPGPVKLVGGVQVLPSQSSISSVQSGGTSTAKYYQSSIESRDSGYNPYSQITTTKITPNPLGTDNVDRRNQTEATKPEIKDATTKSSYVASSKQTTAASRSSGISAREAFFTGPQRAETKPEEHCYQTVSERVQTQVQPLPSVAPIPAAMAISGRTPANEEMPYMTPRSLQQQQQQQQPQPRPPPVVDPVPQQQHFSGDSQDSRGYTSISVREPLSELKSRQKEEESKTQTRNSEVKPEAEGYYMTVSDDSADETYACIDERIQRNGNNTYAQILSVSQHSSTQQVTAPANLPLSPRDAPDSGPPAPPSVDSLKHFVHSRQASSSSAASAGVSSPVTEKKGARSPLPPVPQGEPDLYSLESSSKPYTSTEEKTMSQSIDEMYAKVNKKRDHSRGNSMEVDFDPLSLDKSTRSGESVSTASPVKSPQETPRPSDMDLSSLLISSEVPAKAPLSRSAAITESINSDKSYYTQSSDPGYETVKNDKSAKEVEQSDMESEPGYETLKDKAPEPGYETVGEIAGSRRSGYEPSYETVDNGSTSAGYETVRSERGQDFDPGYEELLNSKSTAPSECDPNYEQLKFSSDDTNEPSYEVVDENFMKKYNPNTQTSPQSNKELPIYAEVKKKPTDMDVSITSEEIDDAFKLIPDVVPTDSTEVEETLSEEIAQIAGPPQEPLNLPPLNQCSSHDSSRFPVIDSPEDVELPPPELARPVSFVEKEEMDLPPPVPLIPDLCSKPDEPSSESTKESTQDSTTSDQETERTAGANQPIKEQSIDDLPPPLPCDPPDNYAEASSLDQMQKNLPEPPADEYPDLPQPLLPSELPLVDLSSREGDDLPDLPVPPPVFLSDEDKKEEMNVTVNPLDSLQELDSLMNVIPPTPPYDASNFANTTNSSSVASVVTIDSKANSEIPVSSISSSSASPPPETKPDAESIMPV